MPHIVKYKEKLELGVIKVEDIWKEDLDRKYKRVDPVQYLQGQKNLFDLIEEIIERTLPKALNKKWFNEFVDIKEVPYGKCNTDTNYRGS